MKNNFKKLFTDSIFYKNLCIIALPIVIQNLIGCLLNFMDVIMVGKLGVAEIASVGIANQYFFLFNLLVMGLYSGCGIFISQFWGKQDTKNIKKVLGVALISGVCISILFTIVGIIMPEKIISIFSKDVTVVNLGAGFLRIVCISYIFTAITFAYSAALRCVEKAIVPMTISAIALLINTILNYIFIFGKFGFDTMGVRGAAIATVIARIIEAIIMVIYTYKYNEVLATKVSDMLEITKNFVFSVYKTAIHVVLNDACWGLGTLMYAAIYGRIGKEAVASVQICTTIQNIFMVIVLGLANASSIMIGNKIGSGEEETGKIYAKRFCVLGIIVAISLAGLLALSAPSILSFFNVSTNVLHDSLIILYITSLIFIVRVFDIILIVGILRGGGDAKYSLLIEGLTMWLIGVPLALIGAFILKLPVYLVVALVTVEEIVKCYFAVKRLLSNKWINNVIKNMDREVVAPLTEIEV
ncbi:MAG: MATE family efflux transporter [Clostridium sp.]|uniref:MATE family efflux transporter n=1 Tax=Clostridium sp. TaxID=1506 RepID=UPI003D6D0585